MKHTIQNINSDADWQNEMSHAFTEPAGLLRFLKLNEKSLPYPITGSSRFSMRVSRDFASRMEKGNPMDPLLLQVLPRAEETRRVRGYNDDPTGDLDSIVAPGLLQKYAGRALLISTAACGIHCRYCFRRNFPYSEATQSDANWDQYRRFLLANSEVNEVILSGGDPLILGNARLSRLFEKFADMQQIDRIRLHTRMPVVLPGRIDQPLIESLRSSPKQIVMVIHCNHANEIDKRVRQALQQLSAANVMLLNQSVLLKDVNDCSQTLANLSETLVQAGVLPYYLHILDKVNGAAHFAVEVDRARQLHQELATLVSGYLLPRLVCETAGASSKTLL